ncbi:MAG: HAD family hydrolase [Chloroflexia bacterium]
MYKLVAFDGDDTLWTPASGLNLSDRTPTDAIGWPDFSYRLVDQTEDKDALLVRRDDGALFALRPEAPRVLVILKARGVLVGVISYNHEANVRRILEAFGVIAWIDYVVAEWHTGKDRMLKRMLAMARLDGYSIEPGHAILVDDDPYDIYRGQCARLGAGFRCFGHDIRDLSEVLSLVQDS